MSAQTRELPSSMTSPETGELLTRGVRPFAVAYKGLALTVDLPGYYPDGEGDGVHVGNDMAAADAALRTMKERVDGVPSPTTIKRVRAKLKLSQRAAGAVFRVGPSAFDKYERGLIEPSGPTIQLITLLDRHPELIADLQGDLK
ncbi:DNA-binding protein [Acidocella aquatica]|uniref:DNA-binding protein n=1 Tax=Acidocella aquatica TaxID=1922313 RepID=A0ABQ6ABK3_9PROT|nr:type II toxin-antitoxin system MqsA family antitoxin [Acidocella aquatica]GLR68683.1 DNA-binding protein [Acidocella aquatica]